MTANDIRAALYRVINQPLHFAKGTLVKPKDCTCDYPEKLLKNGSGHGKDKNGSMCPHHRAYLEKHVWRGAAKMDRRGEGGESPPGEPEPRLHIEQKAMDAARPDTKKTFRDLATGSMDPNREPFSGTLPQVSTLTSLGQLGQVTRGEYAATTEAVKNLFGHDKHGVTTWMILNGILSPQTRYVDHAGAASLLTAKFLGLKPRDRRNEQTIERIIKETQQTGRGHGAAAADSPDVNYADTGNSFGFALSTGVKREAAKQALLSIEDIHDALANPKTRGNPIASNAASLKVINFINSYLHPALGAPIDTHMMRVIMNPSLNDLARTSPFLRQFAKATENTKNLTDIQKRARAGVPVSSEVVRLLMKSPTVTTPTGDKLPDGSPEKITGAEFLKRLNTKLIAKPAVYLAYKHAMHEGAKKLGWQLSELQESVWTGIISLMAANNVAAKSGVPAKEVIQALDNEAIRRGWQNHEALYFPSLVDAYARTRNPEDLERQLSESQRRDAEAASRPLRLPGSTYQHLSDIAAHLPGGSQRGAEAPIRRRLLEVFKKWDMEPKRMAMMHPQTMMDHLRYIDSDYSDDTPYNMFSDNLLDHGDPHHLIVHDQLSRGFTNGSPNYGPEEYSGNWAYLRSIMKPTSSGGLISIVPHHQLPLYRVRWIPHTSHGAEFVGYLPPDTAKPIADTHGVTLPSTGPSPVRPQRMDMRSLIKRAAERVHSSPSDAQRRAGNYRMGHIVVQGLPITIENAAGSTRSGKGKDGKSWSVEMKHHYGYIKRTESEADGDHVDVFVGPHPDSEVVFIIDQNKVGSDRFDEHKVMIGWKHCDAAKDAYHANYSDGWKGFRDITPLTVDQFKRWLENGNTGRPAKGQVMVMKMRRQGQPLRMAHYDAPLNFVSVLERINASNYKSFTEALKQVLHQSGVIPHEVTPAVHDVAGNARASMFAAGQYRNPQAPVLGAAWAGLLGRQPGMLSFTSDPNGVDSVYRFAHGDADAVRAALDQVGITSRTLVPSGKDFHVYVYDKGRTKREQVAQALTSLGTAADEWRGTGSAIGGKQEDMGRGQYRNVINAGN